MRIRFAAALPAGLIAGTLVAGLASASTSDVAAVGASGWTPDVVTIGIGDSVRWTNSTGLFHNVCVASPGATPGTCGEYSSGDPSDSWPADGYSHRFDAAGSFKYICTAHPNMTGTVTVQGGGTGTTNTDTITDTTTIETGTGTTPTNTQTTPATDSTAPSFAGRPRRRSSRKALIVELGSSEAAKLEATVSRRAPGRRTFARVGQASVNVRAGRNVVKLPRKAAGSLRSGAYRVKLVLVDAAGNRSASKTLSFKLA